MSLTVEHLQLFSICETGVIVTYKVEKKSWPKDKSTPHIFACSLEISTHDRNKNSVKKGVYNLNLKLHQLRINRFQHDSDMT